MKAKEISAILMLPLLLLGSILVSYKVACLADDITAQITETTKLIQSNEHALSVYRCNIATKLWEDNSAFCKIFLHHNDSDTIDMILSEFESAVKSDNLYEVLSKGNLLCDRLNELKQLETLSILSLL